MPVGINRAVGPNDRCSSNGPVITASLWAIVEEDRIVGWIRNSAFSVREVQPDGTLAPLDLTTAALAMEAVEADAKASEAGVRGVSSLIVQRRIEEHNTGGLPSHLREAAFDRATVQILDKLQGHSVVGVILTEVIEWNGK